MSLIQSTAIPSGVKAYELEQSLRFDDNRGSYLTFIPTQAPTNDKKGTWNFWAKKTEVADNTESTLFSSRNAAGAIDHVQSSFHYDEEENAWVFLIYHGNIKCHLVTTQEFRDPSAWYNFHIEYDSTQGTASNRVKMYVNGVQITEFAYEVYPVQNQVIRHWVENGRSCSIGTDFRTSNMAYYDGYLAEFRYIDGTALTPSSFGETGDYGEWKPIEYSGSYGTNGFYLPFKQDYTVEGFSAVTYRGTGANHYIGGTGFQPDFTWIKNRKSDDPHTLFDSVRGVTKSLASNATDTEATTANSLTAFNTDGFTLGSSNTVNNGNNNTYVAWNWDMGGSNANNTTGSINSVVRANTAYGQSIVSYTGDGGTATVGHGLSSAPEMIILKTRDTDQLWVVYHASNTANPETDYLRLNTTNATTDDTYWNDTAPTNALFSLKSGAAVNKNNDKFIAYCWHSVSGYSKFGSYEGTGGTHTVTTGFAPAFVMIKNADAGSSWSMWDNTRNPNNSVTQMLRANTNGVEETKTDREPSFLSTGFSIGDADADTNVSGQTYIYMAFADKREYAYWLDQSGNNNDWTSNNLTESDIMVDSPTNNFCTLNPLDYIFNTNYPAVTFAEGNLYIALPSGSGGNSCGHRGTMARSSGKWYWEAIGDDVLEGSDGGRFSFIGMDTPQKGGIENTPFSMDWHPSSGIQKWVGSTLSTLNGTTYVDGDILGLALDLDSNIAYWYKNGSLVFTYDFTSDSADGIREFAPWVYNGSSGSPNWWYNFGADSSFAGTKTAQSNQDGNSIGDFYYTPRNNHLALCTKNFSDPAVIPSENFNTIIYDDGAGAKVTGFLPDLVWFKGRGAGYDHKIVDSVRGVQKKLQPNDTTLEGTDSTGLTSFNSNGFTVGSDASYSSQVGDGIVAWSWKANGGAAAVSSNTNGSINTTDTSANVAGGFSISTYTGNATEGATVGHGLSKVPEMMIVKKRSASGGWYVYHAGIGPTKNMELNSAAAKATTANIWNNTAPTTSVFSLGNNAAVNGSSSTYVAYCFHSVDGYSACGVYSGNSTANGSFVYLGFRPKFILLKAHDSGEPWVIEDTARDTQNPATKYIRPNSGDVEATGYLIDFLSNGFKLRANIGAINTDTYIYMAVSEVPFKYSNAR